ncbi:hypothetical protein D3C73_1558150 [compost metagenome]
MQDAGAASVIDHITTLLAAWLEQQLAFGSAQLALQTGLADVGGAFTRAIQQLASGEQWEQGNED